MATTVEAEVIPPDDKRPRERGTFITDVPRRVLASSGGAWFAWGFIGGLMFSAAAVYIVKKKL